MSAQQPSTLDLLSKAQMEFGEARIVTQLTGQFTPAVETVLEVKNTMDKNWRQAARVTRGKTGPVVLLSPPPNPVDPTDWKRVERLA